jgi:hypothetical protein
MCELTLPRPVWRGFFLIGWPSSGSPQAPRPTGLSFRGRLVRLPRFGGAFSQASQTLLDFCRIAGGTNAAIN